MPILPDFPGLLNIGFLGFLLEWYWMSWKISSLTLTIFYIDIRWIISYSDKSLLSLSIYNTFEHLKKFDIKRLKNNQKHQVITFFVDHLEYKY